MSDDKIYISQPELFAAILKEISRQLTEQGLPDNLPVRCFNVAVEAANRICDECSQPYRPAVTASGLARWLASDDVGLSSKYMAYVLADGPHAANNHPHDPSDFNRCVGFLNAVPEARERLEMMSDKSPQWAGLVANWDRLEQLLREEFPTGRAPKLYREMEKILHPKRSQPT